MASSAEKRGSRTDGVCAGGAREKVPFCEDHTDQDYARMHTHSLAPGHSTGKPGASTKASIDGLLPFTTQKCAISQCHLYLYPRMRVRVKRPKFVAHKRIYTHNYGGGHNTFVFELLLSCEVAASTRDCCTALSLVRIMYMPMLMVLASWYTIVSQFEAPSRRLQYAVSLRSCMYLCITHL